MSRWRNILGRIIAGERYHYLLRSPTGDVVAKDETGNNLAVNLGSSGGSETNSAGNSAPRQAILAGSRDEETGLPDYVREDNGDVVVFADTSSPLILSIAHGFGDSGPLDTYLKLTSSLTVLNSELGYGQRNYVFIDVDESENVSVGTKTVRPLVASSRGQEALPSAAHDSHSGYTESTGTVSASSEFDNNYRAWNAFNSTSNAWISAADDTLGAWIQYEFNNPKRIVEVDLKTRSSGSWSYMSGFIVQGYDGSQWVDLHTESGVVFSQGEIRKFSFSNENSYISYRIYCTEWTKGGSPGTDWCSWESIMMYEILTPNGDIFNIGEFASRDEENDIIRRIYIGCVDVGSSGDMEKVYSYALGSFCIRDVNGGVNIESGNNSYIEDHPFGPFPCEISLELFYNERWQQVHIDYSYGAIVGEFEEDNIKVKTAGTALVDDNRWFVLEVPASDITAAPARFKCRRLV